VFKLKTIDATAKTAVTIEFLADLLNLDPRRSWLPFLFVR